MLPLANPLTTVVLLLGLSGRMTVEERNRPALLASAYVLAIMCVAFYLGQYVMSTFGISIEGLRIAGGMIVASIGFRMLFPQQTVEQSPEAEARSDELAQHKTEDIAFIPLAMPATAGPGTIAMIISTASTMGEQSTFPAWVMQVAPVSTFVTGQCRSC